MNKFSFAIFFLLLFNYSLNLDEESLYYIIINLFKGLSLSENSQCINVCEKNKNEIMKILADMINELNEGKSITNLILPYGLKLFALKDFIAKCQIVTILDIYNRIVTKDGIKEIGNGMYNNANEIFGLINQSKDEGIFFIIGKMLSIVLNIYIN